MSLSDKKVKYVSSYGEITLLKVSTSKLKG